MWYRYVLFFVGAVTIFSVCLYVFEWVLSVKSHNDFLNGSLVGWVFGGLYMIIYTNYGSPWIKNKKDQVNIHRRQIHLNFKRDGAPLESAILIDTMNSKNERCIVQLLTTGAYQVKIINTGTANLCDGGWHHLTVDYSSTIVSIDVTLDSSVIQHNIKEVDPLWTNCTFISNSVYKHNNNEQP